MERTGIERAFPTLGPPIREVGRGVAWLRRRRLSVRGLMVLVLVIGGGLGWQVRSAREQRAAVAAIEALGGSVSYDIEYRNAGPSPYREGSWSPMQLFDGEVNEYRWFAWLVEAFGIDHFGNVVEVRFLQRGGGAAIDETLVHVSRLRRLNGLGLQGTAITDDGLRCLAGLRWLRLLELHQTGISDAGLAHLEELHELRTITLVDTGVTDEGVVTLERALPRVQVIRQWGVTPRPPRNMGGR